MPTFSPTGRLDSTFATAPEGSQPSGREPWRSGPARLRCHSPELPSPAMVEGWSTPERSHPQEHRQAQQRGQRGQRWQAAYVVALAPDPASAAAARRLALVAQWSDTGCDECAVWGRYRGASAEPYEVAVELEEAACR